MLFLISASVITEMTSMYLGWQVLATIHSYWLRWGLSSFLLGLVSNLDPPNLCFLSSWDYRCNGKHIIFTHGSIPGF
jgi:hypothetical protein